MTDYLYRAKQAQVTSEMEIALQEALKNDEIGDARGIKNASGNVVGLSAGGEKINAESANIRGINFSKHGDFIFSSDESEYESVYWWHVVDASKILTNPLGKYYAYYSTDHSETTGGIAMAYSNSIYGPWVNYGEVFVDATRTTNVAGGQTETPSVLIDTKNNKFRMFYQQKNATTLSRFKSSATVVNATGSQSTLSATSVDGITWTVDDYFIIDVLPFGIMPAVGHTGYFNTFYYKNELYAYSLMYGTDYPKYCLHKCLGDLDDWITDVRPLPRLNTLCEMEDSVRRGISWLSSSVININGKPYHISVLSDLNSGGAAGNKVIAAAPISSDLREPLAKYEQVWDATLPFETNDIKSLTQFIDNGDIYLFVVVKNGTDYYVEVMKNV